MYFGQPAPAPPTSAPSVGQRLTTYAANVEEVVDYPVEDIASVLAVDVVWLGGFLFVLKAFTTGIWYEFIRKDQCSVPRR